MFCLRAISLYALIFIWQRMVVNSGTAHKNTAVYSLTRMYHTNSDLCASYYCAAHEVWFMCSA